MRSICRGLGAAVTCVTLMAAAIPAHANSDSPYFGVWRSIKDPSLLVEIEPDSLTQVAEGKIIRIAKALSSPGPEMRFCEYGEEVTYLFASAGENRLALRRRPGEAPQVFERLKERPPVLDLKPLSLPKSVVLSEARILEIQSELWVRLRKDQGGSRVTSRPPGSPPQEFPWLPAEPEAATQPPLMAELLRRADVTGQNTRYLRQLVLEVGWVDVQRFGYAASNAAFLLTLHSLDLPLMLAALPEVEKDRAPDRLGPEAHAYLWDRIQLLRGGRQRYGTQVSWTDQEDPWVKPVEDPEQVVALRKAFGMLPLDDYIKALGGKQVRFSTACSPSSGSS